MAELRLAPIDPGLGHDRLTPAEPPANAKKTGVLSALARAKSQSNLTSIDMTMIFPPFPSTHLNRILLPMIFPYSTLLWEVRSHPLFS